MNKRGIILIVLVSLMAIGLGFNVKQAKSADFNPGALVSDTDFLNINSMDTSSIQRFLTSRNSYLKDFSENGRSAAEIIYGAAHGQNDAAGSLNGISLDQSTGTVSPGVILTTLQKEQSLISKTSRDDNALSKAMGYACPDSGGCNSNYAGFTKQVENAAWTFRYNWERLNRGDCIGIEGADPSCVRQGDTVTLSNESWNSSTATFGVGSKATAVLYRYTPHVYNGNYNFWNLFHNSYSFQLGEFAHSWVSQNTYPTLDSGQSYNFVLTVKNTGSSTWQKGQVNLAPSKPTDRISLFTREGSGGSGWLSPNRIVFQEDSVAPGATATYSFWMRNDSLGAGTYREYFRLVADGIQWMEDYGIFWDVTVPSLTDRYHYSWVSQNTYPTLDNGQSYNFQVTVRNTGVATWQKGQVNLATSNPRDRISLFTREGSGGSGWLSPNRIVFQEGSVAPGATATYSFWMRNDGLGSGDYREYFRVVADGIGWMEDYGIFWNVHVPKNTERYAYQWISQNEYPSLGIGQSYNFVVTLKNTGTATWSKGKVNLGTSRPLDRISLFTREGSGGSGWLSPNRIVFQEDSVAPGATATYSFWMRNDSLGAGTFQEYFRPVVDGVMWLEDIGIFWGVRT